MNITNPALNAIIGGWQVGGNVTVQDGVPVSLTIGGVDNSETDEAIVTIDAELHKAFRMPYNEHHQVQLRFEAFNVLNHPNWGEPNPNILQGAAIAGAPAGTAHSGFGVISGTATAMRQLQLGLKYTF